MKQMTLVPVGGLGNRMRCLAGALTFLRTYAKGEACIRAFWFDTWGMRAKFSDLFLPVETQELSISDASKLQELTVDRPRKRNFFLPRIFQQFAFDFRLYENDVVAFRSHPEKLRTLAAAQQPYVASFDELLPYDPALLHQLFRPVQAVEDDIKRRTSFFSTHTVGAHIRRTDNIECIEKSPIELFFHALDAELHQHPELCIYLATDSEEVKQQMRERYGERIITAVSQADRNSVQGIRDGIADMYALARTKKIYGSMGSSFSVLASELGNIPLKMCVK